MPQPEQQLKKRLVILEEAQSKDDLKLLPSDCSQSLLAGSGATASSVRFFGVTS
jgi:plasmid maintenance system killer protein